MADPSPDKQRNIFQRLLHKHAPSREEMLESRWIRPLGHRVRQSDLWRFTRRSVPRGVAAGLFIGIFLMVPGLQILGATLLSIPLRANIPIAAAMTFLSNPATTPLFLVAGLELGNQMGFHADLETFQRLSDSGASLSQWVHWALSDAAPAMIAGLFVIAVVLALAGYLVSLVGWRLWVGRKWKERADRSGRQ